MSGGQAAGSRAVLDATTLRHVRTIWAGHYEAGYVRDVPGFEAGAYFARRVGGGGHLLTAGSPEGLDSAIRADFVRWIAP